MCLFEDCLSVSTKQRCHDLKTLDKVVIKIQFCFYQSPFLLFIKNRFVTPVHQIYFDIPFFTLVSLSALCFTKLSITYLSLNAV